MENLDLNPNKEEEETPNFCTELGDFYNKKEINEGEDDNENYPEVRKSLYIRDSMRYLMKNKRTLQFIILIQ